MTSSPSTTRVLPILGRGIHEQIAQLAHRGRVNYERTFSAKMVPDGLVEHLSSLHVVQHGIDANNNGKYDVEALGVSTFAESLGVPNIPEEATDPASCGVVQGAGMSGRPRGGVETGGAQGLT